MWGIYYNRYYDGNVIIIYFENIFNNRDYRKQFKGCEFILNPYYVLGLDDTASEEEIKERYKALVEEYTLNQDDTTQQKLEELNRAYDLLINAKNIYTEIRKLIENKNFPLAESKLNMVNDRNSAEWNYLEGFVCVQKGWFETGLNYIRKALELDPGNTEYMSSMNTLQARILEYATKYANQGVRPAARNNMNACGGGNNGGMC